MITSNRIFTPKEVAEMLRLNTLTVYEYIRSGDIPSIRFGRAYRIRQSDFEGFIERHMLSKKLKKKNGHD